MNNSFWLIERVIDGIPHWWKTASVQRVDAMSSDRWTTDVNEARHYDSKGEAVYVIGGQMPGCVATEHLMMGGPNKDWLTHAADIEDDRCESATNPTGD